MTTEIISPWMAGGALLAVLALLWLLARLLRGVGIAARPGARRLSVQDMLPLDARRRLLLIRCDGRELLLLTGGTQDAMLGWLEAGRPDDGAAAVLT
ncbi:flagellar biosynthetic protein FliO [Roseomonas sp. NAR14]|uniref:Flagellar biosynthetic protein FliO n=1 Tax=Roseomonas acroporae TaxID=2937791 RepID=A0A9X1Y251_9PROT|nr:flagellar biosynthetic protein FliO [Roseomonas acroporae]MCK8782764.1 flagellar biosynthetic protein FliO [Roseomonas acroporae]